MADPKVKLKIIGDSKEAQRAVAGLTRSLKGAVAALAGIAGVSIGLAGLVSLLKDASKAAREFEASGVRLGIMFGDIAAGEAMVKNIDDLVRDLPVFTGEAIASARVMVTWGIAQQNVTGHLKSLSKAVLITGADMNRLTVAVARLGDPSTFGRGVFALTMMGFKVEEFGKFAEGAVGSTEEAFKEFGRYLEEEFPGAVEAWRETTESKIRSVKANWTRAMRGMGDSINESLRPMLDDLTKSLVDSKDAFVGLGVVVGEVLGVVWEFVTALGQFLDYIGVLQGLKYLGITKTLEELRAEEPGLYIQKLKELAAAGKLEWREPTVLEKVRAEERQQFLDSEILTVESKQLLEKEINKAVMERITSETASYQTGVTSREKERDILGEQLDIYREMVEESGYRNILYGEGEITLREQLDLLAGMVGIEWDNIRVLEIRAGITEDIKEDIRESIELWRSVDPWEERKEARKEGAEERKGERRKMGEGMGRDFSRIVKGDMSAWGSLFGRVAGEMMSDFLAEVLGEMLGGGVWGFIKGIFMAEGGIVKAAGGLEVPARPGGYLVNIGEGMYDELVIPKSLQGLNLAREYLKDYGDIAQREPTVNTYVTFAGSVLGPYDIFVEQRAGKDESSAWEANLV